MIHQTPFDVSPHQLAHADALLPGHRTYLVIGIVIDAYREILEDQSFPMVLRPVILFAHT